MKPVCAPCQRFFRPKKNGFYFIEGMPIAGDDKKAEPGTATPELWEPYKVWVGDLYECHGCGAQIVIGVPSFPLAEHYQQTFKETVTRTSADQLQVNDC